MKSNEERINNRQIFDWLFKLLIRLVKKLLSNTFGSDIWVIGLRKKTQYSWLCKDDFVPIFNPKGTYLADPFLFVRNNRTYLFCEAFRMADRKGVIMVSELDSEGNCASWRLALERPYHLSYPCIFENNEELWMVPESRHGGSIDLYRCVEFPDRWELVKALLPGVAAVDSTLFEYDDRYWLFTSLVDPVSGSADDLALYWADNIEGVWHSHAMNPLLSDARIGRCAGAIFVHNDQLIRPAQDCAERYGQRIVFNRIELLSTTEFLEVEIGEFGGEWHPRGKGAHTWNSAGDWEVIDGALWSPRWKRGNVQ